MKQDPELPLRVALGSQALRLLGLSSFAGRWGVPRIQGSLSCLPGRQAGCTLLPPHQFADPGLPLRRELSHPP